MTQGNNGKKIRSAGLKSSRGPNFGTLEQVFDNVWWGWGTTRFMPGVAFPRNMWVVKQGDELVVIHPVLMPDAEQKKIDELGNVKHIIRLGAFHGMDDPAYVKRYQPTVWAPPNVDQPDSVKTDHELKPGGELPLEDAELFSFDASKASETAIVYANHGGVLFTCDSVQSWETTAGTSFLGGVMARMMGFKGTTVIGPGWRKLCEPDGDGFGPDFKRLLEKDFRHLLSGHGVPVKDVAKTDLTERVRKIYG